ncbi:MAG TPA: ABC transporter transmembrane domain-containing protein, partial [Rhizomicrobium sp.]|nr:ABC transporter transmembrane domain-containing protein [Rhizomicrobium sp.]
MSQSGEEFANQIQHLAAGRAKSRSLRPLRQIFPFLKPYRWRIVVALVALVISSAATLTLPVAGRGLIDHGFDAKAAALISRYFLAFIAVAAVMGVSGATRFYFVTWIGERVVADIRKAVFDNVLGLSPAFFEVTRTGEVLSRLTADTTLIQTVVGSSISVAMRMSATLVGGLVMMLVTSIKLSALVV